MKHTSELKSGWLEKDMERAERRLSEWKIKKFEYSFSEDRSEETEPSKIRPDEEAIRC